MDATTTTTQDARTTTKGHQCCPTCEHDPLEHLAPYCKPEDWPDNDVDNDESALLARLALLAARHGGRVVAREWPAASGGIGDLVLRLACGTDVVIEAKHMCARTGATARTSRKNSRHVVRGQAQLYATMWLADRSSRTSLLPAPAPLVVPAILTNEQPGPQVVAKGLKSSDVMAAGAAGVATLMQGMALESGEAGTATTTAGAPARSDVCQVCLNAPKYRDGDPIISRHLHLPEIDAQLVNRASDETGLVAACMAAFAALPGCKLLKENWFHIPNWPQGGRGDLVCRLACGTDVVLEVSYITNRPGKTARTSRNKIRGKLVDQCRRSVQWWIRRKDESAPLILGATLTNENEPPGRVKVLGMHVKAVEEQVVADEEGD